MNIFWRDRWLFSLCEYNKACTHFEVEAIQSQFVGWDSENKCKIIMCLLTRCGDIAKWVWVYIRSGNGLVPGGTKAITWSNIDSSSVGFSGINITESAQDIIRKMSSKTTLVKLLSHLPWANELMISEQHFTDIQHLY